jgi:hypothetical protein
MCPLRETPHLATLRTALAPYEDDPHALPMQTAQFLRQRGWPVRLLTPGERAERAAWTTPDDGPVVAVVECEDGRAWLHAVVLAAFEQIGSE